MLQDVDEGFSERVRRPDDEPWGFRVDDHASEVTVGGKL
jgi:hypothetical protein